LGKNLKQIWQNMAGRFKFLLKKWKVDSGSGSGSVMTRKEVSRSETNPFGSAVMELDMDLSQWSVKSLDCVNKAVFCKKENWKDNMIELKHLLLMAVSQFSFSLPVHFFNYCTCTCTGIGKHYVTKY